MNKKHFYNKSEQGRIVTWDLPGNKIAAQKDFLFQGQLEMFPGRSVQLRMFQGQYTIQVAPQTE